MPVPFISEPCKDGKFSGQCRATLLLSRGSHSKNLLRERWGRYYASGRGKLVKRGGGERGRGGVVLISAHIAEGSSIARNEDEANMVLQRAAALSAEYAAATDEEILAACTGLGAHLDGYGGCVFRVWAPHAEAANLVIHGRDKAEEGQQGRESEGEREAEMRRHGNNWSVRVPDVKHGDRYHFVFTHGGQQHERRDAYARYTDYDSNTCFVIDPHFNWSEFKAPDWSDLIIYQLHVGVFTGRDEDGGTFAAIEKKLSHISGLGFTAIELMPVHEYCGSWGYNPRLLFSIHQRFGDPQSLRHLVDEAHRQGISVIFDVVLNHGAARMNSLWAYDGWNQDNKGGIYFDGGKDTSWGMSFAWWQQEVQDMVLDAAAMFLEEYNGDGLRFDCVHAMPWKVCQKITWSLRQRFPSKILISEITPETPRVVSDAGFNATWIHSSYYDMRAFMQGKRSLRKLQSMLLLHDGFSSPTQCVKYFLGCHDQIGCRKNGGYDNEIQGLHRYVVEMFGGRENWEARAMARMWYSALLLGAMGIPMLFMGSEMHHPSWWGVDPSHMLNWAHQGDQFGQEMQRLVAAANEMRSSHMAFKQGRLVTVHFDESNCILGLVREAGSSRMLVVINAGAGQWERSDYGLRVSDCFGTSPSFRQLFNSQAPEFGGWSTSGNSAALQLPAKGGKFYINLPKWSVLLFTPL